MTFFTKLRNGSRSANRISQDQLFTVLSNRRRRYAVHYLKQVGEPIQLGELIEQVAAWENAKPKEEVTAKERKRVYIAFYQGHLTTLENGGLIEYDEKRDQIRPTELLMNTGIYIEIVPPYNIPWGQFYLILTLLNLVLLLLSWYEVGILANVALLHLAAVIVLMYAISAAVQTVLSERLQLGDDGPPPDPQMEESIDPGEPSH